MWLEQLNQLTQRATESLTPTLTKPSGCGAQPHPPGTQEERREKAKNPLHTA